MTARDEVMDTTSERSILPATTNLRMGSARTLFLVVFLLVAACGQTGAGPEKDRPRSSETDEELLIASQPVGKRGGRLVAALRTEPKTLNPVIAVDEDSQTVIRRLMADLIHTNRFTQE